MNRAARRKVLIKRFVTVFVVVFVMAFLVNLYMDARVGGGQRYRGSSRSSRGGGSGGGGQVIALLLNLLIRYPLIGFPLLVLIIYIVYKTKLSNPMPESEYSSLTSVPTPPPPQAFDRDKQIETLQQDDPNFSMPLFLDFCQLLYANVTTFAARQQLGKLGTYLSQNAMAKMKQAWAGVEDVRDIIIGSLSVSGVYVSNTNENSIKIMLQTNYTVKTTTGKKPVTIYENAFWVLNRNKGVKSKGPGEINRFGCPSCGGALDDSPDGKCPYCGSARDKGFTTWYLNDFTVTARSSQSPEVFGGYAPEVGTNDPTRFQPGLTEKLAAFKQTYPDFSDSAFKEKVRYVFLSLQEAWSTQNWNKARPYETDQLFQVHLYWITLYKKEQVRNILKDVKVQAIEIVKIQKDAYYDAITVRVHAGMIDITQNYEGRHLGGDRNRPRYFTEYWTFIRRGGVKETDKTMDQCPNCGASLDIGMVGKCNYCDNKITTGEFNWVLSLIEQDESYRG